MTYGAPNIALGKTALPADLLAIPQTLGDGTAALPVVATLTDQTTGFFRDTTSGTWRFSQGATAILTLGEAVSVTAFRQTADGTDWAPAIQRAHDYLAAQGIIGGTILLPPSRSMLLASTVIISTPCNIIGHGIGGSLFTVSTATTGAAYFVVACPLTSGEVRPRFADFAIAFTQPDVATLAGMTTYPPAFQVQSSPRAIFDRIRISRGTIGIYLLGNCGGAETNGLETSCFVKNFWVDGCEDSVRHTRWHCWPWDLTANQQKVFYAATCYGLYSGRCDDLHMTDCLLLCGVNTAAYFFAGTLAGLSGPTFGTITACDFDTNGGLMVTAGSISMVGGEITMGDGQSNAVTLTGGTLNLVGTNLTLGTINPTANMVVMSGGVLVTSGVIVLKDADSQVFSVSGGEFTIDFTLVDDDTTTAYSRAPVVVSGGQGSINMRATPHAVVGGRPGITLLADLEVTIHGDLANRQINVASTPFKAEIDAMGVTSAVVGTRVVGPIRTGVLGPLAFDSSGNLTVAHGVSGLNLSLLDAWCLYENASGQTVKLQPSYVDGTNIVFAGGAASQPVKVIFEYTDTAIAW